MDIVRKKFNKLPSALKVIIYSGFSVFIGQGIADLAKVQAIWSPYIIIILTILVNVIAYMILKEKDGVK